jgi:hypothetical protein
MREPELLRVTAEEVVRRTVALKTSLPFLDGRAFHLAPGLLMVEPAVLVAAAEALLGRPGGARGGAGGPGAGGGRGFTRDKLRMQPDCILAEIGYWDVHVDDGVEGGGPGPVGVVGRPGGEDSTNSCSNSPGASVSATAAAAAAAASKKLYTRISPDATDVVGNPGATPRRTSPAEVTACLCGTVPSSRLTHTGLSLPTLILRLSAAENALPG